MPTDLPPELLRTIFLHTAKLSTPACHTLCAVSSWVRHLALPVLYQIIFIRNTEHLNVFKKSISHPLACPPSPSFNPIDAVRHLWVSHTFETRPFWTLAPLVMHPNVTHLAIHLSDLATVLNATPPSPSRRQDSRSRAGTHAGKDGLHVILLGYLSRHINTTHSLFRRITHLRLNKPIKPKVWQAINVMVNLTHLAVPGNIEQGLDWIFDLVEGMLIEVFVLVLQDGRKRLEIENWVRNSQKENEWIYAVWAAWRWGELELEWDTEVRGGTTIWEMAARQTQQLMSWDFGDPMALDKAELERMRFALCQMRVREC